MAEAHYLDALKMGKKEYKSCISKGRFPYLPVLDDILSKDEFQTEQKLGLVNVPLEFVVGTSTRGRTQAFAANFMPILETGTEFAYKWANLADAQLTEGIRDPIICYEYMNRYYVVEGNKRVSVLKFFQAVSIPAIVTRKIPKLSEDEDVKLYYEFMHFSEVTGFNTIEFTKPGNAQKLIDLVGKTEEWDDKTKEDFDRIVFYFTKAYNFRGGDKLRIKLGDALLAFISVYGYEEALAMQPSEYNAQVAKAWSEILMMGEKHRVGLVMDPVEVTEKRGLFAGFLAPSQRRVKAAFLYPRNPETSDWVYAHELGRNYLEETFPENIETVAVSDVNEDNIEQVLMDVIRDGATIIFGIAPQMMAQSLKVAVEHPEVKILNCSLNTPHKYIRTYYARMYEAKFVSGMIAGALAENGKIGYIADYPIYGMIANINAFALGASIINPRAKIYLAWSTMKDFDREKFLRDNDIHFVSDQDMITPDSASRMFGVYQYEDGQTTNLVMPLWNWGAFYGKMIQSVLYGAYQSEEDDDGRALNYWWGMSAGVIDLIFSGSVPYGVKRLAQHVISDIRGGFMPVFSGEIRDQEGNLRNREQDSMKPENIMKMDWLIENVIGSIPSSEELVDGAKSVVELKGVEENK